VEAPGHRVNLGRCLVDQERFVEAHHIFDEALRYGQGPIDDDVYRNALRLNAALKTAVARIVIEGAAKGTDISLDGEPLQVVAGEAIERVVEPGPHVLVAARIGYQTRTDTIITPAGVVTQASVDLALLTETRTVYPMSQAIPWSIFGGGLAVAASGIPLLFLARDNYDAHDAKFDALCPSGCPRDDVPSAVTTLADTGDDQAAGAAALFAVGGAAVVTGIVLLILNSPEQVEVPIQPPTVTPTVAPGGAGVSVRF
jgi:hypothetical protein